MAILGMLPSLHDIKIIKILSTLFCNVQFIQNSVFTLTSLVDIMFHLSIRFRRFCTYKCNKNFSFAKLLYFALIIMVLTWEQMCYLIISGHVFLLLDCYIDWMWNQLRYQPLVYLWGDFWKGLTEGMTLLQMGSASHSLPRNKEMWQKSDDTFAVCHHPWGWGHLPSCFQSYHPS